MNPLKFSASATETERSTAVAKRFGNRNDFDYPDLDLGGSMSLQCGSISGSIIKNGGKPAGHVPFVISRNCK